MDGAANGGHGGAAAGRGSSPTEPRPAHASPAGQRGGHHELPLDPDVAARRDRPDRVTWSLLAVVAAGGALGAPARYLVGEAVTPPAEGFPTATFLVNTAACFALGLLLVVVVERRPSTSPMVRAFLGTGFLGAFSTFSTAVIETDLLVRAGRPELAGAYLAASVAAGIAAVVAGMAAGRAVPVAGA